MSQVTQTTVRNRLLAALPPDSFGRLAGSLQPVGLDLKQVLFAPGQPIETVYFPESGMVSMLAALEGNQVQEVGLVGREGLVGLPVVFGADSSSIGAMTQAPGTALRMRAAALREALERTPALRALLLRYMQAFYDQVAQTGVCNGRHALESRLARWLLLAHDRAEADEFPMLQEFLCMMLGTGPAGVTRAVGTLRQAGVIDYGHGRIAVLDRPGLEAASCECYGAVRRQYERLLGPPAVE